MTAASGGLADASLKRRLLSLIYESLILAALLLFGALPVVILTREWDHAVARAALQIWLLGLCGLYYVWQWARVGQTLPMKTWRLQLLSHDGSPVTVARAMLRYVLALGSTALLGMGFLWALIDRDRHFLHDRLAGTRIINTETNDPAV
ncbi:MAG: RDD family protein [Burkholderiales bacterium]